MNTALQSKIDYAIQYQDNILARELLIASNRDNEMRLDKKAYLKLSYLTMSSLSPQRLMNLVKESILTAYEIPDFNLEEKLSDYIELIDSVPDQVELITGLKSIIEQHQELLGDKPIVVKEKNVPPTISNWIKDLADAVTIRHDVLEEIRYINRSPNPQTLTIARREILKNIFRIYDRMAQYAKFWEELPEEIPEDEMAEFEAYLEEMDNALAEGAEQYAAQQTIIPVVEPPVVPKPQPIQKRKPVPIIPSQPDAPPLYKIGTKDKLKLGGQDKKGLVYDTPTNIDIDAEAKARQHRQVELLKIQVKLDDLKKAQKEKFINICLAIKN
ncbi:hypothetical protein IPM19_03530 [bacterium]|nr:MAG: hypothetical protein IPM19_03530 [bacterium]